jgi:hypothetical protein
MPVVLANRDLAGAFCGRGHSRYFLIAAQRHRDILGIRCYTHRSKQCAEGSTREQFNVHIRLSCWTVMSMVGGNDIPKLPSAPTARFPRMRSLEHKQYDDIDAQTI